VYERQGRVITRDKEGRVRKKFNRKMDMYMYKEL
jgi:hypothetical protein